MRKKRIGARERKRKEADKLVMEHMKIIADKIHEVNQSIKNSEFELTESILNTPYFKVR